MTLEWSIIAHEPSDGPFNERFGSLCKTILLTLALEARSEIWSTITNASTVADAQHVSRIVTCSEDQTCKVWAVAQGKNPVHVKTLTGHTLAVTSVDWKRMANQKEYFLSCSDDNFIRVYDPSEDRFDLLYTLDTKFIRDWHTLTYMALEEGGEHVAVVSENGYLFVWNLLT